MSRRERRLGGHAPISLQLMALLLASLVVAQTISFATVVLMPPPRPPVYRLSEVAAALRGGPLKPRWGRPLQRTLSPQLPADLRDHLRDREHMAGPLAAEVGAPLSAVRLTEYEPSPEWRLEHWMHGHPPHPPHGGPFDGDVEHHHPHGPNFALVGEFAAAVRQPDGTWTVVRATPEPFPTGWQLRTALWLLSGLLLVASAGYLFARRITAPLKRFAQAAEALGRDPHGPLMTLSGPAEIGAAARAFNEMQVRLRRYIDDRTGMVGAISHDLRTPLARIRFKIERAPPALRDSVLSDVAQMEQMIGAVLAFIRDEGMPRQRETFDLLSLLECVVDDAAMLGGDVELVSGAPVMLDGDPVGLRRLFENLIDNAVKYGGQARVQVRQAGGMARVEIADRGPGLSEQDLGRVFQPFYRTDASRNLDNAGVGLGLPIARATARAHGGDVELTSGAEGVVALVTLPAHPATGEAERRVHPA